MKKISIAIFSLIVLLNCLNPFVYCTYRSRYSALNTLNEDFFKNLQICENGNLNIVHESNEDAFIALFNELLKVEFSVLSYEDARNIIFKYDIDEKALYTSVPTNYLEEDRFLSSIQFFDINDTSFLLCNHTYKNGGGSFTLFSFKNAEIINELLQDITRWENGHYNVSIKWIQQAAIRVTLTEFVPMCVVSAIFLLPYVIKEKRTDAQTRNILATMV